MIPDSEQDFDFTIDFPDGSFIDFTLDDDGTELNAPPLSIPSMRTFSGLLPDTYFVTELVPPGFDVTSTECTVTGTGGTFAFTDPESVEIRLEAGDTIECTFTNGVGTGIIKIIKDMIPDSEQDFDFTIDFPDGSFIDFTLDDDGTELNAPPLSIPSMRTFSGLYQLCRHRHWRHFLFS